MCGAYFSACVSRGIVLLYQRLPLSLPPPVEYAVMTAISPSWISNFSGVRSLPDVNESLTRPIDAPYSSSVCVFLPSVGVHVPTVVAYLGLLVGLGVAVHGSGRGALSRDVWGRCGCGPEGDESVFFAFVVVVTIIHVLVLSIHGTNCIMYF